MALSFYHFLVNFCHCQDPLESFLDQFLAGKTCYQPFFDHNLMYWDLEKQGYPNILYLSFEEMKKVLELFFDSLIFSRFFQDIDGVIRKTQDFLGKKYSEEQIEQLKEYLSFENMKSEF